MRHYFVSDSKVKKAAMRMAALLAGVSLARLHCAISVAVGYRDFHHFQQHYRDGNATESDEMLSEVDFRARAVRMVLSIAKSLNVSDGDVQYAFSYSRLTGNRSFSLADHEAIRCECWRRTVLPWAGSRSAGAIVIAKGGRHDRRGYLIQDRVSGSTVECVSDLSVCVTRADFEVTSPKVRMEDFVPLRLYLPYGVWVTKSGNTVIFSRNYKPLWVVSPSGVVTRPDPWIWIEDIVKQDWFGGSDRAEVTWHENLKQKNASAILTKYGISGMPKLVEALPVLIGMHRADLDDALELMRGARQVPNVA